MVGPGAWSSVALQGTGKVWHSTKHKFAGGDVRDRSRGLLVQFGGGTIYGPRGLQLELLKSAEKHKTCFYVIGAMRPAGVLGGPSVLRAQKALEQQLRVLVPCVLQGHIRRVLHAKRVGLAGAASLARDIPGYPVIYMHNQG